MSKKLWCVFWLSAVFLLFFLNGSLPITDSVESNYALTAKEMVLSGDWVSPQIYGRYWFDKPIMFYWLTALGFEIFGFTEFAARFFPAIVGLLSLGMMAWGGKKLYGEKAGFFSAVILLTTIEFFLISKSILTDQVLFLFFNAALLCFYLAYAGENKNYYYGTYAFSALATLTKGPIGFLLPGLIIVLFLLWERNWRELKHAKLFSGTLLFLLLAGPWYGAMIKIHGDAFIGNFLGTHNFLRATVSEHPRDNVIYYYTMVNIAAFFPWIGFVPGMLCHFLRENGKWRMPCSKEKFLLLWVFVIFFFYQNMATKYITYTYPLLCPLAFLTAGYFTAKGKDLAVKGALLFNCCFFGILTVVGAVLIQRKLEIVPPIEVIETLVAVCFAVYVFCALLWVRKLLHTKAIAFIAVLGFVFNLGAAQMICVPLMADRTAKEAGKYLQANFPADSHFVVYGRYPTSGVFYSSRRLIALISKNEVQDYIPKAFSWSGKNVMPYETYEQVQDKKPLVVLVSKSREDGVNKLLPHRHWQRKEFANEWVILSDKE